MWRALLHKCLLFSWALDCQETHHDRSQPCRQNPGSDQFRTRARGPRAGVEGQTLEHPNPNTQTVDKVLTPTSIKDTERQTDAINERLDKAERKLDR